MHAPTSSVVSRSARAAKAACGFVKFDPPRRFVLKCRNELFPDVRAKGYSRFTAELEKQGESVKLTLIHETA